MYINQKFVDKFNKECILLEIKLPREIFKSPLATEVALASLLQSGGVGNWYAKDFSGGLPAWSSLEIASLEGVIHFYIRINKKFKELVEANFYAQYPGIEIVEADDYTQKIRYHHLTKDVSIWGASYKLGKTWLPDNLETGKKYTDKKGKDLKMPADFLPIKTYVDYELDKDPKEEFKTDPITPLLEFMGGIGKGEYYWYQIIVQDESVYDGDKKFPKFYVNDVTHDHLSLADMAKLYKDQVRTNGYKIKGTIAKDEYGYEQETKVGKDSEGKPLMGPAMYPETKPIPRKEVDLTPEEKEDIELVNKKISKPLALVIVRLIYVAKSQSFKGNQIQNILAFVKPYKGAANYLGFKPVDTYDFKWQNVGGKRVAWRSEELFEEYVEREGFFPHITGRDDLDKWEDMFFYPYPMKVRKMFRMIYEGIFHPFDHPHADRVSIMNLEEIATLWHLPGQVAATPTLPRIDSVKGNAPSNLPM